MTKETIKEKNYFFLWKVAVKKAFQWKKLQKA